MKPLRRDAVFAFLTMLLLSVLRSAQGSEECEAKVCPTSPSSLCQKFVKKKVDESAYSKYVAPALGLSKGRNVVLLAGVSQYPNLKGNESLVPAANDLQNLRAYLQQDQAFDDVIELTEKDFNRDNLRACLVGYIAPLMRGRSGNRFLMLYTGHGFATGEPTHEHGYLLTTGSLSFDDDYNSVDLAEVRLWLGEILDNAFQSLVLINSCYSGSFFNAPFGKASEALMSKPGAHAITASGSQESAMDDKFGNGSIFFDAFLEAVRDGRAKTYSTDIITVNELFTYITDRIANAPASQTPRSASLRPWLPGGYFFPLKAPSEFTKSNMEKAQPPAGPTTSFGQPLALPAIDVFEVSPTRIVRGAVAQLRWKASAVAGCTINNGIGDVAASGSQAVTPVDSISFQISCIGGEQKVVANTRLLVDSPPRPRIVSFDSDSDSVPSGESVALRWEAENVENCQLENDGDIVESGLDGSGSRDLRLRESAHLVLTCSGADGDVSRSLNVTVAAAKRRQQQHWCCQPNGAKVCLMTGPSTVGTICGCAGLLGSGYVCS